MLGWLAGAGNREQGWQAINIPAGGRGAVNPWVQSPPDSSSRIVSHASQLCQSSIRRGERSALSNVNTGVGRG